MPASFDDQLRELSHHASYEAAVDLANELAGLLIAEERATASDEQRRELQDRRRNLRRRVSDTDPSDSSQVAALLTDLGVQLRDAQENRP